MPRPVLGGKSGQGLDLPVAGVVLHFYKCNGGTMESAITVKGQATIPKSIREISDYSLAIG